ncbi:hypothetical protein AVEN_210512-1 [Araneus ventricosus]|uniref:Uncharacterized protein n=1 Tax=Araneus ventricosus TaxID=182803 RepID=A0A4Y2FGT4_ARAVE|nr:hypothetical protein AVEN_210512-1 [Araneus ventricosus]
MKENDLSLMVQDQDCRPCEPISPIPVDECALLCLLLCGTMHYRPRTKPIGVYCHFCSLVISVRSFGTHLHLFPASKAALSGKKAVKKILLSLCTDFYQNGF